MVFKINDLEAFDSEEGVNDFGLIGQSRISDGSANTDFQDNVLIYNENFGRAIDTTDEWTEALAGVSTKAQTGGILTLTGGPLLNDFISEKNNGFIVNVAGKSKKIRLKMRMKYSANICYFGFQSITNYVLYFIKGGATTWNGYIMDEDTNEYTTVNFSVSKNVYHDWEIIFNSNRADFYVDGVLVGFLNGNISVADTNLILLSGQSNVMDIDYVRVWEAVVPK